MCRKNNRIGDHTANRRTYLQTCKRREVPVHPGVIYGLNKKVGRELA